MKTERWLLLLKSYSIWHCFYDDLCERTIDNYKGKFSMKIKISFCVLVHISILRWLSFCAKSSRDEVVIIIICCYNYWIYEIALRDKLLDQLRRKRELSQYTRFHELVDHCFDVSDDDHKSFKVRRVVFSEHVISFLWMIETLQNDVLDILSDSVAEACRRDNVWHSFAE
jgi:hypothetical protein